MESRLSSKICEMMDFGTLTEEPKSVSGGLLHKIFEFNTSKGRYAVKILNPQIINEDLSLTNFIFSEKVAQVVHDNGINALPAISINNNSVFRVDEHYFLAFHWFDGKTVPPNSIETSKCRIIGELLAKIHNLNFSEILNPVEKKHDYTFINWSEYVKTLTSYEPEWKNYFLQNVPIISNIQEKAYEAYQCLSKNLIISHRDLLQKNVLWNINNVPMIIDWESAGFINPGLELLDISLFWSGGHKALPNLEAFTGFIKSYCDNGGNISESFDDIITARFKGKLEWLDYNVKGALGINCNDMDEQQKCSERIVKTIDSILIYIEIIPTLKKYLNALK